MGFSIRQSLIIFYKSQSGYESKMTSSCLSVGLRYDLYILVACLGFILPLEIFFTHMETSPLPMKDCKFWPMLGTHDEMWEFFSVPHLLWHGAFVNNGRHLRGLVTLTPIAERLTVELSLPVFITSVCRDWDSNTQPSACGSNALNHCTAAAVLNFQCIQSLNTAHAHVQESGLY